jgi:hypothetical protein
MKPVSRMETRIVRLPGLAESKKVGAGQAMSQCKPKVKSPMVVRSRHRILSFFSLSHDCKSRLKDLLFRGLSA